MKNNAIYVMMVLVASSCYGIVTPLLKVAYNHGFSVSDVTHSQYAIACVILWIMSLFWRKGAKISHRQWGLLIILGLVGAAATYSYNYALDYLPASLGIVLLFQFAWIILIIDMIATRRIPSKDKWIGVVVILVGTVLAVNLFGSRLSRFPWWALLLGLIAAVFFAAVQYFSRYVDTRISPPLRSAIVLTVSALAIMPAFPPILVSGALEKGLWFYGGLIALFYQAIPLLLNLIAIPRIGGRMAGVLGCIELPVAVLVSTIFLKERTIPIEWTGVLVIILGMVISEWTLFKRFTTAW